MVRERDNGARAECPRRIEEILLGRPQGVVTSQWDKFRIPAMAVRVPGVGSWDGEFVFARAAGGGFKQDVTINAIAKSRNVWTHCIAGRPPSGSRDVERTRKDADSMPKRNDSGANARRPKLACRKKGNPRRRGVSGAPPPPPSLRVVTQQRSTPNISVIGRDVTSPCGNLRVRLPRIAVTPAVRP